MPRPTFFLDCGHGTDNRTPGVFDPGAVALGTSEYAIVQTIAHDVAYALRDQYDVVLTPEVSLNDVVAWVNERATNRDMLFALHMNAGPAKATGVEVIHAHTAPMERAAQATLVANVCAHVMGIPCRGVRLDTDTPAGARNGLAILRDTTCPALLVELGFITNKTDVERVRLKGTLAICESIRKINEVFGDG